MTTDDKRKGALGDHQRQGRKYLPAMATRVQMLDGVRDQAPDFIWIAMVGVEGGDDLVRAFVDVQRAALLIDPDRGDLARFDGRLSTLESWSPEDRAKHLPDLKAAITLGALMPDSVLAALRLYPDLPGAWLLIDPWQDRNVEGHLERALLLLARAITEWGRGDHLNALTKYLTFCWAVQAGGMTWDSTFAEFLADFPVNAAKRSAAGSMIRAGYTAHQGALEQGGDRTRG